MPRPRWGSSAIKISESALEVIRRASAESWPTETGGILVGVETSEVMWVTKAIEVASTNRGTHSYRLPADVTPGLIEAARTVDARLGYLGDWHSHPALMHASSTDRRTMQRLARIFRRPQILLVAMPIGENDQYEFDARVVSMFGDVEVDLGLTGDLETTSND